MFMPVLRLVKPIWGLPDLLITERDNDSEWERSGSNLAIRKVIATSLEIVESSCF